MSAVKEAKETAPAKKEDNHRRGSNLFSLAKDNSKHRHEKDKDKDKHKEKDKSKEKEKEIEKEKEKGKGKSKEKEKDKDKEKEKDTEKKVKPTYRVSPTPKAASSKNINEGRHEEMHRRLRSLSAVESVNFGDEPLPKLPKKEEEEAKPAGRGVGTAPVLMDNYERRSASLVPNNESYYNVDEERANMQLMAQQQFLHQQQLNSMARARFLAQQQQRLFQNAWMPVTNIAPVNPNNGFFGEQARCSNQRPAWANEQQPNGDARLSFNGRSSLNQAPTNNDTGNITSMGSDYSIVPTTLSQHNSRVVALVGPPGEIDNNLPKRESSFSEFVLNMYDMDDHAPAEQQEEAAESKSREVNLQSEPLTEAEEQPSESRRDETEDVGPSVIDVDVADDSNFLESSLFDVQVEEDGGDTKPSRKAAASPAPPPPPPQAAPTQEKKSAAVAADVPVPVVPSYSRVMSLAVVLGKSDRYVVNNPHLVTVAEDGHGKSEHSVDEAVLREPGERLNSILLQETSRQVVAGHRSALLTLLGEGGSPSCLGMLTDAVEGILCTVADKKDAISTNTEFSYKVEVSLFLIQDEQEVSDLYNPSKGRFAIKGIANPIAGHWLDGLQLREVTSAEGAAAALEPCRTWLHAGDGAQQPGHEKEALGMFVMLRQVQQNHGNKLIYLSSLFSLVSKSGDRMQQMCIRPETLSPSLRSLVRRIGHGTYTVATTFLTREMKNSREYLTQCRDLSAIHSSGLLSGNLDRYMRFAQTELAQSEEAAAKSTADTKEQLETAVAVQRKIIAQMESFAKNPKTSEVPFFPDLVAEKEFSSAVLPTPLKSTVKAPEKKQGPQPLPLPTPIVAPVSAPAPVATKAPAPAPVPAKPASPASAPAPPSPKAAAAAPAPAAVPRAVANVTTTAAPPQPPKAVSTTPSTAGVPPVVAADFADQRIHTVAIVDTGDSGFTVVPDHPVTLVRKADGTTRPLDEILVKDRLPEDRDVPFSTQVTKLANTFAEGTNCALFSYDGRTNNLFESPAWTALFEVVRVAVAKESQSRDLRLSVSLVKSKGEVTDLLRDGDAASTLTVASSPLFGPIVHSASMQKVQTEDNVRDMLFTVATNAAKLWSGECIMYVTLLNTCTVRTDVIVNSFMTCISGSHSDIITSIMDQTVHPDVLALHRAALLGSSACVLLLSLNNVDDSNKAVKLIDLATQLRKDAPRAGSVSQFVHHTRSSVEKRKAKLEATTNPEEKRTMEKLNRRIENMMKDYEHLLYDPTGNFPQSYIMESAVPKEERRTSPAARSNVKSPATVSSASNSKQTTAATSPQAPARSNHPQLIVGIDSSGSIAPQVETTSNRIVWKPTNEVFEADQVVSVTPDTKTPVLCASPLVQDALQLTREGRSVAFVGIADSSVSAVSASQPVWSLFDHVVREGCFSSSTWTKESNVELRLVVLQDRTIVADFLDEESIGITKQVQVAASTLFGPVVRNVKAISVSSEEEWKETLNTALGSMDLYFRQSRTNGSTIVIGSAIRREVRDGDVILSSVNTYSFRASRDLPALRDVLLLDPQGFYPTSLFRYAFGGPCRMLCVASLVSDEKKVSEMLQVAQRVCFLTSSSVPSGSVQAYLSYQEKRQANANANGTAAAAAQTDGTKKHTQIIMEDMRDLMAHPTRELPIYTVEEPRANGAKKTPGQGDASVMGIAIATYGREEDGSGFVVNTNTNTVINKGQTYTFDEVLSRADNSAVIRPSFLDSMSRRFLDGYNQCLFVTDGTGSQVGPAIVSRIANIVLQNCKKEGLTLYLSLSALRFITPFGEIKDLIQQEQNLRSSGGAADLAYDQLSLAASPLFGFCLGGVSYSAVSNLGDLHVTLKNAQSACATDKASLIISLVAKQILADEKDVVLNSIFIVLTNAESTPASRRVPQMLCNTKSVANSSHFAQALNNACYTYAVVGVTTGQDKDRGELLDETTALMKVRVRVPKRSSAKELLAKAQRILTKTNDEEDVQGLGQYNWACIKEDTQELLASPQNGKPKAYIIKR